MALADGKSSFKTGPISLHTQTAIHIAEKLANVSTVYIYTGNIYVSRHLQDCQEGGWVAVRAGR